MRIEVSEDELVVLWKREPLYEAEFNVDMTCERRFLA